MGKKTRQVTFGLTVTIEVESTEEPHEDARAAFVLLETGFREMFKNGQPHFQRWYTDTVSVDGSQAFDFEDAAEVIWGEGCLT